jgi:hypothetical protein
LLSASSIHTRASANLISKPSVSLLDSATRAIASSIGSGTAPASATLDNMLWSIDLDRDRQLVPTVESHTDDEFVNITEHIGSAHRAVDVDPR